ncbi:hypothetical protein BD410DRAFT_336101 [Rickenella mellea]|uniref:Uncharacterized protein n=1 Tax=Rickenella mellea TaxID=50990 RepID=A0A4Y7QJT2_9AGAM|nr:hypothetical protein BD410DRAFT_336101 [Rickenella mellea]
MILPGPDGTARMKSFDLRDKPFYSDYGFAHCESWLQAAAHTAAKHVQLRDLIFVTGIDMVNAWALFAFSSSSDLCSVNITTGPTTMRAIRQDSPPSASFNCPPIMNYGPVDRRERGSLDQCVVIRRFKMHRRIDKLWWQMNKGLRKVLVKRTEVPNTKVIDGASEPEHANGEDAENVIGGSETEDKKSQRRKRTQTKPTPESPIEDSDLQGDRRDGDGGGPGPGGAGGAGSSGTDVSSSRGLPPGNSGGRRDTGSGNSATGGGNGQGRNVSRYALKDDGVPSLTNGDVSVTPEWSTCEFDDNSSNDSEDGYVDYERLEPLDALLEYILEACPSADYAGAGDHDLTSLRPLLYDWDTFPARLRTEKPEVHLQSNGLALLKDSVYYRTLVLHDLRQADLDEFTASFQSQLHAEDSKETESPKVTPNQSQRLQS